MELVNHLKLKDVHGTYTFAAHHIDNGVAASSDVKQKFDKIWDMTKLLLEVSDCEQYYASYLRTRNCLKLHLVGGYT